MDVLTAAAGIAGFAVRFTQAGIGFASLAAHGTAFTDTVFAQAQGGVGVVLGPVSHNEYPPPEQGGLNPSGQLRRRLDLYANIRPARVRPRPALRHPVRPGGAGEHRGLLRRPYHAHRHRRGGAYPDPVMAVRTVTRQGSPRIAESAFELAMQRPAAR